MDFTTDIFELFGGAYLGDFSKYMYQADVYGSVFYVTLLLPVAVAFVYYIILDHILLAKNSKWVMIGGLTAVASTVISLLIARTKLHGYIFMQNIHDADIGADDYVTFGVIVFAWAAIFFAVFSVIFKSFSSRCRNIPF
jgi:hypothetical protein